VAAVTPDGRLPNADVGPAGTDPSDAQHLRDVFYRMGFNDQEIVALSGAHALGRCHTTASGYDGPWTPTPTTFNNAYFTLLKNLDWTKRDWSGPFQYEDGGKTLMMLPTDLVLLKVPCAPLLPPPLLLLCWKAASDEPRQSFSFFLLLFLYPLGWFHALLWCNFLSHYVLIIFSFWCLIWHHTCSWCSTPPATTRPTAG